MQSVLSAPSKINLSDKHHAELHASGLTDQTIEASGIYTVDSHVEIARLIGWTSRIFNWNAAMVIPYPHADGYCRVKPDFPRYKDGKPIKYESPLSKPIRAYFPPGFHDLLATSSTVIVTEGEKKALAIQQFTGLPCIGLGGVWAWHGRRPKTDDGKSYGKRKLIADLDGIEWKNKEVLIVFDSDAASNDFVRFAESSLALALTSKGASVRIARIPPNGNTKVGADDFLVAHGIDAFRSILTRAEDADQPPPPGPMDLARWYIEDRHQHADGSKIRWWRDEFHVWDDFKYRAVADSEIDADILQWLDDRGFAALPRVATDVRKCLASEVHVSFAVEQPVYLTAGCGNSHELIAMQNGIINLAELVAGGGSVNLRPHTPLWFSPMCLPYEYNAQAECPIWFQTLTEIFDGDDDRVEMLAEWFGYCVTADTSQHGILLLEGPPRSGKSTILRTLAATIGTDNVVSPALTSLSEMFGLWPLVGKRVAIFPDAHLGHGDKAIGVLERLKSISGEDPVDIHRKHLRTLPSVRLGTRFALAVNELPKFGDNAGALGPRVHILSCRNSFTGKEDRQLESKLAHELAGIFNWLVDGLRRLKKQGTFTKPEKSKEVEADFARLVSPLRAFMEEWCIVNPGASCTRDELWAAWQLWCNINGHAPGCRELLGNRLRAMIKSLV